ncbi:hypothetical protein RJ640_002537 [Escallonia rubra]|uniref:R3H domain-containing protein n=1 Tax=Escallonia rubra TaxID=112253 RepID=A0AA88S2D7_9ASTE|nr:hypothetical protein RJ640_002537 [Escallonia rubra]
MQVEELASLIKDNLPCKHLVLSAEAALINFLQDDTSSDGVLELEPMNSYNRLLLHRLADIFGFSHQSIGEGDDRHLVLERSQETTILMAVVLPPTKLGLPVTCLNTDASVSLWHFSFQISSLMFPDFLSLSPFFSGYRSPSILVSDLLWQYDDFQPLELSHSLSRSKVSAGAKPGLTTNEDCTTGYRLLIMVLMFVCFFSVLKAESPTLQISFKEREAAYLAARERIFSVDEGDTKGTVEQKPRHNPVVARRMIAHALGQKIESSTLATKEYSEQGDEMNTQENKETATTSSPVVNNEETKIMSRQTVTSCDRPKVSQLNGIALVHEEKKGVAKVGISGAARNERNIREEQIGAAKRIFAHALRFR